MNSQAILNDLRATFGPAKSVLYADEVAQVLGKTTSAVYSLLSREGLPFPVIEVGGRPAVSIYAVAAILAGEQTPSAKQVVPDPSVPPALAAPKRKRADLGTLRRSAALAFDFFAALDAELERIELDTEAREATLTNADLDRHPPL
jgi:hypothetical protein